ncbi:MAG: hypothetical protein AB8G26_15480 [Ilumatobacter sp.]
MGPAPLPPHERNWRHPSELAAMQQVDDGRDDGTARRVLALAGGATVAVIALVFIATTNFERAPSPLAVTASTMPMATVELQRDVTALATPADDEPQRVLRSASSTMTRSSAMALSGAPHAVSAAPVGDNDPEALDLATALPGDDDVVLVLTRSHTFRLTWEEIGTVLAPDGSIVVTVEGGLVAVYVSGELRMLVDA